MLRFPAHARKATACVLILALLLSSCDGCVGGSESQGLSPEEGAANVVRELESIADAGQRAVAAVVALNTLCSLGRLAAGQVEGPVETALVPYFNKLRPEVRASIATLRDTLGEIPAPKRAELLGDLSAHDPGACSAAPNWEGIRQDVAHSHLQVPRLRANYCSGNLTYGDGTAAARAITAAAHEFVTIEGPLNVAPGASPVILGVEGPGVTARHPALAATAAGPVGNGISPFGVETNIPCTFGNDTCDANQGLICGLKMGAGAHCIAFPVVQKDADLILRGYNFWDIESARLDFAPVVAGQGVQSQTVVTHVDANEPTDAAAACPPASAPNPTHNRAHFTVSANEGHFYRLRMFNRNGTFVTQADALDDQPSRVVHICYPASSGPADLPAGTVRDCTRPSETCVQDGATCAATWATPPRKLDDCRHLPGEPVVCGETPEWFEDEALSERTDAVFPVSRDPIVYVIGDEPSYEILATVQAIECKEETGVDWPGSDEPMFLVAGFSPDIPPGSAEQLIEDLEDNSGAFHGEDYDSGERKRAVKLLSHLKGLRFDSRAVYLEALVEDDSFLAEFLVGAAILVGAALLIYFAWPASVALWQVLGGAGIAVTLWAVIMGKISEDDLLGRATLEVTPLAIDERTAASHAPDFLSTTSAFSALPLVAGAPEEFHRSPQLLHPFVDQKLGPRPEPQCDPGACPGGQSCLVNRCVEPGFVDPTAGRGFRERREFWGSGGYYGVDVLWEKVQTP